MDNKFIIAITGPAGAGKTTVSTELAKQTEQSVNIDADIVKHFLVNGFVYDDSPEGVAQWELLGRNIGQLAKNFYEEGYNVIVNGYINEPAWKIIDSYVNFTDRFLLLPTLAKIQERDAQRPYDAKMGNEATKTHHEYFSNTDFYKSFKLVGSTNQSPADTVTLIKQLSHLPH